MKIVPVTANVSLTRDLDTGTEAQRAAVEAIIQQVRETGDEAVRAYTKQFDGADLDSLRVTDQELEGAYAKINDDLINTRCFIKCTR